MTVSVKNISGEDRVVPLGDGSTVTVLAGDSYGFPDAIGNGLLLQTSAWQPGGAATNVSLVVQVNGNSSITANISGAVTLYTDSGHTTQATFPATITSDTTYYAQVYGQQNLKVSLKDSLGYEHFTAGTAVLDPAATPTTISAAAPLGNGTFALALPAVGGYTYDPVTGNVLTDPEGHTYTYNSDGTVATETFNGVTRTYNWASGQLASVS